MIHRTAADATVRAGDLDGLGSVYSEPGSLILRAEERILGQREGCDIAVYGSWRVLLPKRIFHPLPGKPTGRLFVTSDRLVFLRRIDVWREIKPLLTPLGLPTAAEKESRLKDLTARGALQYCEINTSDITVKGLKRRDAIMHLRMKSDRGRKYELIVRTDADDPPFFDLLEGTIGRVERGGK